MDVPMASQVLLRLTDGLLFSAGPQQYRVESTRLYRGQWVLFVPQEADPATDPAGALARTLASLATPQRGAVEILGRDAYSLSYREVQRLRARLGFVQGYGGLLSNRSITDNVALPLSIHGKLSLDEERTRIEQWVARFNLTPVARAKPHQVDGYTRWRACLARATILLPSYLVLEGIGDWEVGAGHGVAWRQLEWFHQRGDNLICICASRQNVGFENWFVKRGGIVIRYRERHSVPPKEVSA